MPAEDIAVKVAEEIELNRVYRGENVKFVVPYDEGVFYGTRVVRGVKVVSNVQLYADLCNMPSGGGKAASQILELIRQEWQKEKETQPKVGSLRN